MIRFRDRSEAGKELATQLKKYANRKDVLVLALPRGGVLVGHEISKALHVPLDAIIVRKLGVPGYEELAMGAIAMNDVKVLNPDVIEMLHINDDVIAAVARREQHEMQRRNKLYRQNRPFPEINGKIVILVDDGLATGATMRSAVAAVKTMQPSQIIVAVPVSAARVYQQFKTRVDEVVCLIASDDFDGIGQWYDYFPQNTDEQVCELLASANEEQGGGETNS